MDGAPTPPLIIGASSWSTIQVAIESADGVNVRRSASLGDHLERLAASDVPSDFDVSVLDFFDPNAPEALLPGAAQTADLEEAGVDRLIVTVWPARATSMRFGGSANDGDRHAAVLERLTCRRITIA